MRRRLAIRLAAAAGALALLCGCVTAQAPDKRTDLLRGHVRLLEPEAPGPAPLVIFNTGCGGLIGTTGMPKQIMPRYAVAATRAGAYAVIVDSFSARDLDFDGSRTLVCSGVRLRPGVRGADALAAESLAKERWGDSITGVILAGWSHGGWVVLEMLADGPDARRIGDMRIERRYDALDPQAVVLFYPYCGRFNQSRRKTWAFHGPMLLVTAEIDEVGPREACLEIIERARGGLDDVETLHFEGATHAFDELDQTRESSFVYDPELAQQAEDAFTAFIRAQVED